MSWLEIAAIAGSVLFVLVCCAVVLLVVFVKGRSQGARPVAPAPRVAAPAPGLDEQLRRLDEEMRREADEKRHREAAARLRKFAYEAEAPAAAPNA